MVGGCCWYFYCAVGACIVGVVLGAQESVAAGGEVEETSGSSRQLYCSARACVLLSTTMLAVAADNFVALRVLELSVLCFLLLLLLHADQIIPDISIARASVLLSITSDTMHYWLRWSIGF